MKVLIIQTLASEGPGRVREILEEQGWEVDLRYLEGGDPVPSGEEVLAYGAAVLLGGPMSVYDHQDYPFLKDVARLSRDLLRSGLPTLGICLGAQFLALASGRKVYKNRVPEVGFYEVELTPEGCRDPLFRGVGSKFTVFQWHDDTFDLPEGAALLASSPDCRCQAVRFGARQYGLQFHVELTREMIYEWVTCFGDEIVARRGPGSELAILEELEWRFEAYQAAQERVIQNFLSMAEQG